MALFGLLNPGDHVVTTAMEHNSVLRPLHLLEKSGVSLTIVDADPTGYVSPEAIASACNDTTRLIAMTHCSNVTGTLLPIEEHKRETILFGDLFQCLAYHGLLLLINNGFYRFEAFRTDIPHCLN